jgi:hypothetical protein
MAGRYAAGTDVTTDRSRAEIERTLRRYGARQFAYAWDENRAIVGFAMHERQVRFTIAMPDPADKAFTLTPTGKKRAPASAEAEYEAAVRQIWRVFALVIKAKLETVAAGLVEFQAEFLAHIVLPGGQTVGDAVQGRVGEAYATGTVPELLSAYGRPQLEAGASGR